MPPWCVGAPLFLHFFSKCSINTYQLQALTKPCGIPNLPKWCLHRVCQMSTCHWSLLLQQQTQHNAHISPGASVRCSFRAASSRWPMGDQKHSEWSFAHSSLVPQSCLELTTFHQKRGNCPWCSKQQRVLEIVLLVCEMTLYGRCQGIPTNEKPEVQHC